MDTMRVTMLSGLGCGQCGGTCGGSKMYGLGDVADYDVIKIGGNNYSVNAIRDKTIYASRDTKTYSNPSGKGSLVSTVKAGQPIGKVYSYILPSSKISDGRGWLQFEGTYGAMFFVPNENASSTELAQQGVKTVEQEVKEEQEKLEREEDPITYYAKKLLKPVLIGGAVIFVAVVIGKEVIKSQLNKKTSEA